MRGGAGRPTNAVGVPRNAKTEMTDMSFSRNMPYFRKSLLSRLALFASHKAQQTILEGGLETIADRADILELWDWGPADPRMDESAFTDDEVSVLRSFDAAVNAFLEEHGDYTDDRPENDFIYDKRATPSESWLRLMALARETLERFEDFDTARWEREGLPTWV